MKTMIICMDGLEECEALLTYDILYRGGIEVELVGKKNEIISSHNVVFKNHKLLKDIDLNEYECLILPGGMPGTTNLENDEDVSKTIDYFIKNNKLVCAICAAPSILIHKGLLKDNEFTCYPGFENDLISTNKKAYKFDNIITGIGLGGTIEFASLILETLKDLNTSNEIKKKICY